MFETNSQSARVIETHPSTDPGWARFVAGHPNGSIYHHPLWLNVLEQEYGQKGVYLSCTDANGQMTAVLPLLYTRGFPFKLGGPLAGRRLSSLPRTPVAGPLSIDTRATIAVLREAVHRVRKDPGTQVQIKTQSPELDGLVEGLACQPWRLSYVLGLPNAPNGQYRVPDSHERAKIKWAVKKASRLGVVVRPADSETDLRGWYDVYLETMRRNTVPPRPYRFFAALWKTLRPAGMMQLLIAEFHQAKAKKVIAGSVLLMFGQTVSYAFNGMHRQYGSMRANDAILWHAISEACQKGFRLFDFGEVPDDHWDLARFKSKWGAQPTRLYRYINSVDHVTEGSLRESNSHGLKFAERLWAKLPLKATAWFGDRIYSYL